MRLVCLVLVLLGMVGGYPLYGALSRDVYRATSYDVITKELLGTGNGVKTTFTLKYAPVASGSESVYLVKRKESLGTGNGVETTFTLDYSPVAPGSERVYLAGVTTTDYSINYETGEITFDTAPGTGVAINVDYNIAVATTDYSINHETGEITFDTAPEIGAKINADYLGSKGLVYTLYLHTSGICQLVKGKPVPVEREKSGYWSQQGNEITFTHHVVAEPVGTGNGVETKFTLDYSPVVSGSEIVSLVISEEMLGTGDGAETTFTLDYSPVVFGSEIVWLVISEEMLGTGDGAETTFTLDYSPVVFGSVTVYLDGGETTAYSISYITGEITFDTAPEIGVAIKVDYKAMTAAYSINYETGEITFDTAPGIGAAIKVDYKVGVETAAYSINYETGEITFDTAPVSGAKIKVDYLAEFYFTVDGNNLSGLDMTWVKEPFWRKFFVH